MNWDLLGHTWAVDLLREHIHQGGVRHAYLICGPQGIGRRTLALRFAQALNCLQPPEPGDRCGVCRACTRLDSMQHPDLSVVQAEEAGGVLKVEDVRLLQHRLSLTPYEARFRVALLLRFEEANQSAQNALLKTLEEPPSQAVLVLTAESPEVLLPTIVSRCEILRLHPLPTAEIERSLQERWGLPPDSSRLLAHISGGRPGNALRLANDPNRLALRQAWLEDLQRLLKSNRIGRFAYVEPLAKNKEQIWSLLPVWLSFWRDIMLQSTGSTIPLENIDWQEAIQDTARRAGTDNACRVVASIQRTQKLIARNINTRLALEVLMLDLPNPEIFR